jgi:hypothetical protein
MSAASIRLLLSDPTPPRATRSSPGARLPLPAPAEPAWGTLSPSGRARTREALRRQPHALDVKASEDGLWVVLDDDWTRTLIPRHLT